MSVLKQIGDAIVTYINDSAQQDTYNTAFEAKRSNLPIKRLEDMGTGVHVVVFAGPRFVAQFTSRSLIKRQTMLVAVAIRRPKEDLALEDTHIELAEQIEDSLWKKEALEMGPAKRLEDSELSVPPFTPEELEQNGVLVTFIPLTYTYQVTP